MAAGTALLETIESGNGLLVAARGRWDVTSVAPLDARLRALKPATSAAILVDLAGLEHLDTIGAWLLYRTVRDLSAAGFTVEIRNASADHSLLIDEVSANDKPCEIEPPQGSPVLNVIRHVGAATMDIADESFELISFLGTIVAAIGRLFVRPGRLRFTSLVYHMEEVGLNAIPIVALISFLIGVVLAYQGATQLRQFGAEVFVVDLVAISVLREIGILLTAIIIAGRSGSAFTAQIGSMKVNEEVDAMRTLGLDPIEILVLPRVLALLITMPLLAFIADLMGLLGGGLMAWVTLDISPAVYIERLNQSVSLWSFFVGLIKAPVFAFIIAMIGCFEGLKVEGSAESVGQKTTRAVVEAIFLVIVFDAVFSIFFAFVGV
ncbi:MAG: ABC transporter permease [Proteobacteria bacterium]|nr:ABC transporter permease [Pseudomonadota bacterium]